MIRKTLISIATGALLLCQNAAFSAEDATPTRAEVRNVDRAQQKITLAHDAIKNLDMPAMTMVFRVADPKLLEGVNAGDTVHFSAEKRQGLFTVTGLQRKP